MRRISLAGLVLLAGCAQDLPGAEQPADQLYFPQGMVRVQQGNSDLLVVASTNFDQRYNSGRLTTFDIAALFEVTQNDTGEPVRFQTDYAGTIRSSIRIDSFSGELEYVPANGVGSGPLGQLFVATRFRNLLTMIDIEANGALSCGNGEVETDFRFDCTPARFVSTESEDPFALAVAKLDNDDIIGVGHLRVNVTATQIPFQNVSLVARQGFMRRLQDEASRFPLADPVETQLFADFGGVSGMVYIPDDVGGFGRGQGSFLTLERTRTPDLTLKTFALDFRPGLDVLQVEQISPQLSFVTETRALRGRGLVYDPGDHPDNTLLPPRVYASLGFQETADSFNSAVAVIDPTGERPRFVSAFEVGDELGPAAVLRVGSRRFLYVPDLRLDRVYVLDASSDDLRPVATILGAVERRQDGELFVAGGLSAPARVEIVRRDIDEGPGEEFRTLGFVTNFLNSTLAVLDLTDPDPRRHRLIARFGRAFDAFGDPEGP